MDTTIYNAAMHNMKPTSYTVGQYIMCLFNSRTQAHIYHLQTLSYAQHKALDNYYNSIIDLVDTIVEAYQGKYGIIKGYQSDYKLVEDNDPLSYMKSLLKEVETQRYTTFKREDTNIQNELDNVVTLINSTIYKLSYLK